jgi:ABC-type antimicrobial peptide transport system permease subunit
MEKLAVVRAGVAPCMGGAAIGLGLVMVLGQGLERLLFGVGRAEPVALLLGAAVVVAAGGAAAMRPAWRAAKMDPASLLKHL